MSKATWKEATLNHIKAFVLDNNGNVFSLKQLSQTKLHHITADTRTQSKNPTRTLDKTLRELKDFNILKHRNDIGMRVYEYIPNHHNEELIYKEKRSIGHIRVIKCLDMLGIKYEEEKTFPDMKHVSYLRLDVYFNLFGKKVAIEYDGSQHQKAIDIWGGNSGLENTEKRDLTKTSYCVKNGIQLYRIGYEVKDIEKNVIDIVCRLVLEHVCSCLLTVFMYLYSKLRKNQTTF